MITDHLEIPYRYSSNESKCFISGTPKWMVFKMENPIKMDDLGVALFLETSIYCRSLALKATPNLKKSHSKKNRRTDLCVLGDR